MQLSEIEAFELQQCMCVLIGDEYPPDSIGYDTCGWEFSVNIIYRCMVSGIWTIWNGDGSSIFSGNDYYAFCKGLSEYDPEDAFCPELFKRNPVLSWETTKYWTGIPYVLATPLNDVLLDKYSSIAGEYDDLYENLCVQLIEEIEALFEKHGVPWSAGGLFLIGKKEHANPTLIDIDTDLYKLREREMPASLDPNAAAENYISYLFKGQIPPNRVPIKNCPDCWFAKSADNTTVIYRPASIANSKTLKNIAMVEIINPEIRAINRNKPLKIKFPRL